MLQATAVLHGRVETTPARARPQWLRLVAVAAAMSVVGGLLAPSLLDAIAGPAFPVVIAAPASATPRLAVALRADASVPDASRVFSGRETPTEEPAPTF